MTEKHIFAFYTDFFIVPHPETTHEIHDQDLMRRLSTILRMKPHEPLILFNKTHIVHAELLFFAKKFLRIYVKNIELQKPIVPFVTLLIPLLKRQALEEAVYSAVEIGVHKIQLVVTHKSQKEITQKEYDRLIAITIAAAEQSKNYVLPMIEKPLAYEKTILNFDNPELLKIICDTAGSSLIDLLEEKNKKNNRDIILLVGPESGFMSEELALAVTHNFFKAKLTQGILRALQAVAISLGIIRSR